jgi:2-keto-4-pentenoate hydratase
MVRVKNDDLNDARSIMEAARHLSHIVAFIELADGTFDTNAPFDAGVMVAGNVGARLGVLGEERAVDPSQEFVEALGRMSLVLKEADGKELSRVSAEGMMGHPLNPLLWFLQDLNKRGQRVKAGDVISLGSPSPAVVPVSGKAYTLVYEGLPAGPLTAAVSIR